MAVALDHPRTAERRHGEASFRSGTTSRLTFSCYIVKQKCAWRHRTVLA